jgi:hypothetical protein
VDYYIESAGDDEGALGVDDEFDIYEDLNLDAILLAGAEEGGLDAAGDIYRNLFVYIYVYIYVYMYIYICIYM